MIALSCGLATVGCADVAAPRAAEHGFAPAFATIERPFHGRIEGTLNIVLPFEPGSAPLCNANFSGDPAAPGPALTLIDEATGVFLHLGRVALRAVSCVDPASPYSSGTGTITAANGDQLFIRFENTSVPDPADPARLLAAGPQWVTGGTGRFEHASGAQSCTFTIVLLSPASAIIRGSCAGTVSY
jgi:hypothetical protein